MMTYLGADSILLGSCGRWAATLRRICWVLVVGVAWAGTSCGGEIGSRCAFDTDCRGGSVCVQQSCYATCTTVSTCEPPYDRCEAHTRSDGVGDETVKICVSDRFNPDVPDPRGCELAGECCTSDAECVETFDGDQRAVCGIDQRCIIPVARPRRGILIRDRTPVESAEQPEDGGVGADIAAMYVQSTGADTDPLGWAETISYAPAGDLAGTAGLLDGSSPTLNEAGTCVSGDFAESTVSLGGAGGYILVGFVGPDDHRLALSQALDLVVVEWGRQCGAAASDDAYDVYVCEAQPGSPNAIDPASDCSRQTNPDGPVSGYQILPIAAP